MATNPMDAFKPDADSMLGTPTGYATPEQIAQIRQQASAMQAFPKEGIHHWTQGLAYLLNVIQGNREATMARGSEASGRRQGADAISQIYAPYLAPGGGSSSAPSGGPSGAPSGATGPRADAGDGHDPTAYINRLFQVESSGNPDAVTGSNRGLAQFSPDLEQRYGITDANRTDPHAQMNAVIREQQEHAPILRSALGRDPTPGEQYLMHQQGIAGGPALLTANPDQPAWRVLRPFYSSDAIAKSAVTGNLPKDSGLKGNDVNTITAGQFSNYWKQKFEGGMGRMAAAAAPGAITAPVSSSMPTVPPAPIPPGGAPPEPVPVPNQPGSPGAPPVRMAYAGPGTPPGMLPSPIAGGQIPGAMPPSGAPGAPNVGPMLSAIAGRPMNAPGGPPPMGPGAPAGPAPTQVAGPPQAPGGPPMGAGGPAGLPSPLTSPVGQITPEQLTRTLSNPWVPESAKAAMLQMIQSRAQPQTMDVEGGKMMFDAAGHKVFIPEPKFGTVKVGGAEIPTVSHYDPATRHWNTTTLAPGGGVQTGGGVAGSAVPGGEPDLSSIGGIQRSEVNQAAAKKGAEEGATQSAKYYDSLHKGLAGSAMIAAQQKQNIDVLRQVAATKDFSPGAGSEGALGIQRLAARFGINPEGAAPRELFNQVATRVLADQISGIKSMASETGETGGRIFKSMLDLEEKANITPEDTAAGINAKLNLIDHAGNLMMKWGDLADDYVKEHGRLDPGFDKGLRSEIAKARIPNAVPGEKKAEPVPMAIEAGYEEDGYRFKGGDPHKEENWEKVK